MTMNLRLLFLRNRVRDEAARLAWRLPYDTRRRLFLRLRPAAAQAFERLRTAEPHPEAQTLVPAEELGCIFVHVPKNGGTSIARSLFGDYQRDHFPVATYQMAYSRDEFERLFTFGICRNPYDRLLSAFRHGSRGADRVEGAVDEVKLKLGTAAKPPLWQAARGVETLEQFVLEVLNPHTARIWEHLRPQHRFLAEPSGRVPLDFVGRFETLDHSFALICERLGVEAELMHDRRSRRVEGESDDFRDHYTPAMRKVMENVYRRDFELFDYSWDG